MLTRLDTIFSSITASTSNLSLQSGPGRWQGKDVAAGGRILVVEESDSSYIPTGVRVAYSADDPKAGEYSIMAGAEVYCAGEETAGRMDESSDMVDGKEVADDGAL